MQVVVDSLVTNYQLMGKGRLIVLLHGWGDTSKGLAGLAQALSQKYQVLVPDLPGFGGTQTPSQTWGLDDYSNFVGGLLAKLDLKPYAVIGHSNGGAIAMRGLAAGHLKASRLVLLASAGIRSDYKTRKTALRLMAKTAKMITAPLPKTAKNKLKRRAYSAIGSDLLVAEHLQETFKKVVTDDLRQDASRISLPTLLIYGQTDTATPTKYGEAFHKLIPNSRLETLPAGHFVHIDQPDQTIKLIESFLDD